MEVVNKTETIDERYVYKCIIIYVCKYVYKNVYLIYIYYVSSIYLIFKLNLCYLFVILVIYNNFYLPFSCQNICVYIVRTKIR